MVCVCVKHLEVEEPDSHGDQLLGGEGLKESQDGREDQEPLIRQKKESQWFVYLTYAARIIFTWIGN